MQRYGIILLIIIFPRRREKWCSERPRNRPQFMDPVGAGPKTRRASINAKPEPHKVEGEFLGCYGVMGLCLPTESRVSVITMPASPCLLCSPGHVWLMFRLLATWHLTVKPIRSSWRGTELGLRWKLMSAHARQCWIPDPLNEARDWTQILMYTRQIRFCCAPKGTPRVFIYKPFGEAGMKRREVTGKKRFRRCRAGSPSTCDDEFFFFW